MINVNNFVKELRLNILSPTSKSEIDIPVTDINRPGMQFFGFYEFFAYERPQIIGKTEMTYMESLEPSLRLERFDKYFSYDIPCVIVSRGMYPPDEFLDKAKSHDVPIFQSHETTTNLCVALTNYINKVMSPRITQHGVLLNIFGTGVLITGDSGVGKSEAALELINRGHQLVADDVVDIHRVSSNRVIGEAPDMIRHFMEIRGIGIIDIKTMFGIDSVANSKSVDLVMHLEKWDVTKEYDRFGKSIEYTSILGVKIPHLVTPVKPGRNIAIIIEVAVRNMSLRKMGYSAADALNKRIEEMMLNKG